MVWLSSVVHRLRVRRSTALLILALFLGTVLRGAVLSAPRTGHDADQQIFVKWTQAFHEHGIGGFYPMTSFCNYPPLFLLALWFVGQVVSVFDGVLMNETAMRIILKIPANLADLAIALLLYRHGKCFLGPARSLGACCLYYFNPVSIYISAYWGQVDSIHGLFLLAALIAVSPRRWVLAGLFCALAVLQKFQSVAILPLVLFEVYRIGRWNAVARWLVGAVLTIAVALLPFYKCGVAETALRRGYVDVIGQYNDLSRNAYNVWYLLASPSTADTSVPPFIARIVADGRLSFSADESWLLWLTWRHISLMVYATVVAVILSLYSLRPNQIRRLAAGGALGLAFFLFPTEMHERYAYPAIVLLPLWAVSSPWRERLYVALCAMLALNLAAVVPAEEFAPAIAAMTLAGFFLLLGWLAESRWGSTAAPVENPPMENVAEGDSIPKSTLITAFRGMTVGAIACLIVLAGFVGVRGFLARSPDRPANTLFLSDLKPTSSSQGWGELRKDRSVSGELLQISNTFYLRGLGGHARSIICYAIPLGCNEFRAEVGINRSTVGRGGVVAYVELDGAVVFESSSIKGWSDPIEVHVPISGAKELTLRVEPTRDGTNWDHVDWALARFVVETPEKD